MTHNDNEVVLPEIPVPFMELTPVMYNAWADQLRAYATEAVRLNQPAGGEAVENPEHDGDTCCSSDFYAGNSVGWWKSKADNYGVGLLKVAAALRGIGVKLDGSTPCWEYVAKLYAHPADALGAVRELAPCPFCGDTNVHAYYDDIREEAFVRCMAHFPVGPECGWSVTAAGLNEKAAKRGAIERWNAYALAQAPAVRVTHRMVLEANTRVHVIGGKPVLTYCQVQALLEAALGQGKADD